MKSGTATKVLLEIIFTLVHCPSDIRLNNKLHCAIHMLMFIRMYMCMYVCMYVCTYVAQAIPCQWISWMRIG